MSSDDTATLEEKFTWKCVSTIRKFEGESTDEQDLIEEVTMEGNSLMYGGASALWEMLIGNGSSTGGGNLTYFNSANAYIGVGDSTTANAATFTDLQASTNKTRVAQDSTYPQHTDGTASANNTITYRATFGTAAANYAWQEWGVFNGATGGRMLNRAVQSLGTKTSSATWQLTVTLTLS